MSLHNHAKVIVACDFFVVVTASFRTLYVFVIMEWRLHYNRGRPHSPLGPGIPEPDQESVPARDHRHKLPAGYRPVKTSVLGALHHEYRLVKEAA